MDQYINMKAFDFFKPRLFDEIVDFNQLENKYEIIIPPILRIFLSNYSMKRLYEKTNTRIVEVEIKFDPNIDLGGVNFYSSIEGMFEKVADYKNEYNEEFGLIPLASSSIIAAPISIGSKGDLIDKVIYDDGLVPMFKIAANDIFHLVRGLNYDGNIRGGILWK